MRRRALASRLRDAGHDALHVAEIASGATDAAVPRQARTDGRVLLTKIKTLASLSFARSWLCLVSCFFAFVPSSILSNGSVSKLLSSNSAIGRLGATWSSRRPGSVRGRCSKKSAEAVDRSAPPDRRGEGARGELTQTGRSRSSCTLLLVGEGRRGVSSQAMARGRSSRCPTTHRLIPGRP
jgi:hypothetical protein